MTTCFKCKKRRNFKRKYLVTIEVIDYDSFDDYDDGDMYKYICPGCGQKLKDWLGIKRRDIKTER